MRKFDRVFLSPTCHPPANRPTVNGRKGVRCGWMVGKQRATGTSPPPPKLGGRGAALQFNDRRRLPGTSPPPLSSRRARGPTATQTAGCPSTREAQGGRGSQHRVVIPLVQKGADGLGDAPTVDHRPGISAQAWSSADPNGDKSLTGDWRGGAGGRHGHAWARGRGMRSHQGLRGRSAKVSYFSR